MKKISIAIAAIIIAALIIGISVLSVKVKNFADKIENIVTNVGQDTDKNDGDKTDENNKDDTNDNDDKKPVPSVPTSIKVQSKDVSAVNGAYILTVGKPYSFEIVQDNENHAVLEEYNVFNIVTTATGSMKVGYYQNWGLETSIQGESWEAVRSAQLSEFKDDILTYSLTGNTLQITLKKSVNHYCKNAHLSETYREYYNLVKEIESECYFTVYVYNSKLGVTLNCNFKIIAEDTDGVII